VCSSDLEALRALGYEPIWTGFGRRIVKNLTTVTTSVRGFTTHLLGYYFASQIIDSSDKFDENDFIGLFLKFEQLAAYSRYAWNMHRVGDGSDIRGIQRVEKNMADGKGKVVISSVHKHQILSEQRTYGLWGLFSVSAKNSGLIDAERMRVTPDAQEFIENTILPHFEKAGNLQNKVLDILIKDNYNYEPGKGGRDEKLGKIIAELHKPSFTSTERAFYTIHLLYGDSDEITLQRDFWERLVQISKQKSNGEIWENPFLRNELREVISISLESELSVRLQDIDHLDWLLYITNSIYSFLLGKNGISIADIAKEIPDLKTISNLIKIEPLEKLKPIVAGFSDNEHAERLLVIASLIKKSNIYEVISTLIAHNAEVMKRRWGGGAWIAINDEKLDVRFGLEETEIGKFTDYNVMYSTYFLNSVKQIGKQLLGY